ncbi:MAG TPA: GNAT family N-acetyltransferase [Kofleriaceae bacterium]|nr:GNAT family N-acetyltransferase [Kofleriaceae bacterium]
MELLSGLDELDRRAAELDRQALAAPYIDRFCSSSSWILPAAAALMPPGQPLVAASDLGFLAAVVRMRGEVRAVEPCEASWGLASPLVGHPAEQLAAEAAAILTERERDWDVLVLSGLPLGSPLLDVLAHRLARRYRVGLGPATRRHIASLDGGLDGFLSRRPRRLRKTLRQSLRRAAATGLHFEPARAATAAEADALFDRLLAVEQRSWKGRAGVGLVEEPMREFYRLVSRRLAEQGRHRLLFARAADEDVGFVLGAVFGTTYRGLQFSYDDRFAHLGLGNLAQYHQLTELATDPAIESYDLGTGGEYKIDWAESSWDSVCLIAAR